METATTGAGSERIDGAAEASTAKAGSRVRARPGLARRRRGYLYKRPGSPFWWMAVGHRGRLRRETTRQTDKKKAKEILDAEVKRLDAADAGYTTVPRPEAKRVRVDALLDGLVRDCELRGVRSLGSVRSHLVPIREWFGTLRALDVTSEEIDAYISARKENQVAPVPLRAPCKGHHATRKTALSNATINRGLQLLGQALRPFLEKHQRPMPTLRRLPERNTRQGFFEKGEVEAVIAALPTPLGEVTRFAFLTGWRKSEITGLTWTEVDRESGVIRLSPDRSKNEDGRLLTIDGPLADLMARRWMAHVIRRPDGTESVSPLVFHREGEPIRDFGKAWASACQAAGVPGRLFHDLRRSSIRNMVRAGVPERVAMQVSGHKTRSIFDRYNIVNERDLREAMQRTSAYLDGLPAERRVSSLRAKVLK